MTEEAAATRERLDAVVEGRVQGVGFRWFVRGQALRFRVDGWVANRDDGSVQVVAEGSTSALDALVRELRKGPAGSSVTAVRESRSAARGEGGGFRIRHGSHTGD